MVYQYNITIEKGASPIDVALIAGDRLGNSNSNSNSSSKDSSSSPSSPSSDNISNSSINNSSNSSSSSVGRLSRVVPPLESLPSSLSSSILSLPIPLPCLPHEYLLPNRRGIDDGYRRALCLWLLSGETVREGEKDGEEEEGGGRGENEEGGEEEGGEGGVVEEGGVGSMSRPAYLLKIEGEEGGWGPLQGRLRPWLYPSGYK